MQHIQKLRLQSPLRHHILCLCLATHPRRLAPVAAVSVARKCLLVWAAELAKGLAESYFRTHRQKAWLMVFLFVSWVHSAKPGLNSSFGCAGVPERRV